MDKKTAVYSVLSAFALNTMISLFLVMMQKIALSPAVILYTVLSSGFFILPLLCLFLPDTLRFRYRIGLSGLAAAVCWVLFFSYTDAGKELVSMLRTMSDSTASILYSMVPEGFERSAFKAELSPDAFYVKILNTLLYSILPVFIAMYALGCRIALFIAKRIQKKPMPVFRSIDFYNEFIVFIPLVLGMTGIISGKFFDNRVMTILYWNVALAAGLYYILQGFGILSFFMALLRKKRKVNPFFVFFFVTSLFLLNGVPYFLGCLLIAGVVELFVPLRMRFDNKDVIDPTPGRDNDQL